MFGTRLSRLGSVSRLGLVPKAIAILRKYGADAHVYLPGIGTLNGITAGNYLDSAGTTAASVDNPVGLSLDALQAMTLGSELVTNGTNPTVTTSWSATGVSVAAVSSEFQVTRPGQGWVSQAISVTVGKTYVLTATARKGTSNLAYLRVSSGANGVSPWGADAYTSSAINAPLTLTFVPAATTVYVNFGGQDLAGTGFYNNISVREIPGIHATQGTTANKPILRRGLLNLLTQAQTYSHADWVENTTGTASAPTLGALQLAPDGTTTAQRVTFSCPGALISDQSMLDHASMTVVSGQPHTQIAYIKGTPGQTISFRNVAGVNYGNLTFDGTWQLLARAETSISTTGSWSIGLRGTTGSTTGTVVADLWTAGLFQGTYTAQQIIDAGGIPLTTSAAASSATGKYWWQFDGSNDSLSLSAPLFQMSDDHAVIVGAKCARATGTVQVVISPSRDASNGNTLGRLQFDASGTVSAAWTPTGGAVILTSPTSLVGSTKVLTAYKTGNTKKLRIDGVLIGSDSTAQTDLGMTSAAISDYRTGLQLPFEGSIYPVIAIKGTVTDADLLTLERFVGQLSGVSL